MSRFITPRPKSFFCPKCGNKVETEGKNCLRCEQAALEKIAENNLRNTSLVGSLWGTDVIVSNVVPENTVATITRSDLQRLHDDMERHALLEPNGIVINPGALERIGQMVQQSQVSVGIEYIGESGSILPLASDNEPLTPGHYGYSADQFEEET